MFYVTEKKADLLREKEIQKRMWVRQLPGRGWGGGITAAVQALSFSRERCWFRFGSRGKVPGALFTGDEPLI